MLVLEFKFERLSSVIVMVGCFFVIYCNEFVSYFIKRNFWEVVDMMFGGDVGIVYVICVMVFGNSIVVIGFFSSDGGSYRMFLYILLFLVVLDSRLGCK